MKYKKILALVHYPCVNKQAQIISSSITNIDIHDIARSVATFELDEYAIINPLLTQLNIAKNIIDHWQDEAQKSFHPDRHYALSKIKLYQSLDELINAYQQAFVVLTDATDGHGLNIKSYDETRKLSFTNNVIILFGTAYGISNTIYDKVSFALPPIYGPSKEKGYNHLSVRAAVAIILYKLFGK